VVLNYWVTGQAARQPGLSASCSCSITC